MEKQDKEIKYVEPIDYFPKEIREKYYPELEKAMKEAKKKEAASKKKRG